MVVASARAARFRLAVVALAAAAVCPIGCGGPVCADDVPDALQIGIVDRATGAELCTGRDVAVVDLPAGETWPEALVEARIRDKLTCAAYFTGESGRYRFRVSAPGYRTVQLEIVVPDDGTGCGTAALQKRTVLLEREP